MDYAVLEIHDLGLKLWRKNKLLHTSPGYALLDEQLLFGEQAKKQARIQPQNIHNRFWFSLDTQTLNQAFGEMRHSADIAHEHLLHLAQELDGGDVVIIIPSHYSKAQLSLLLGIVAESKFHVVGLVESCLAHTLPQLSEDNAIVLDIQLHNTNLAKLELSEGLWQCCESINLPDLGWLVIQEKLCRVIADTFISQTRFDPLKDSNTEQELYDQLTQCLELLQTSVAINIALAGHTARIDAQALEANCQIFYQTISQALPALNSVIYCPPLLKLLPGFNKLFPGSIEITQNNLIETITANEALIIKSNQSLSVTRSLPASIEADITNDNSCEPTHILYNHTAHPLLTNINWIGITDPGLQISARATTESAIAFQSTQQGLKFEHAKNCQVTVNGEVTSIGAKLKSGDCIQWHEHAISLITVQEKNGL